MPSVMWKELTAEDLRAKAAENAIVVLPVASMEQHGPHLPVGVDTFLCEAVCKGGAELAVKDQPVVVAPTLWCGMAEHHMAFGGTFTFDIPTYMAVLRAFLASIKRHGFKRVFIVNGHGGNIAALNAFLPDFTRETGLKLYATTYFEMSKNDLGAIPRRPDAGASCVRGGVLHDDGGGARHREARSPARGFRDAQRRSAQGFSGKPLRLVQGADPDRRRGRRAPRECRQGREAAQGLRRGARRDAEEQRDVGLMVENRPFGNILPHLILWIGIAIVAFPVYLAFVGSTHEPTIISNGQMPIWPGSQFIENYYRTIFVGTSGTTREPVYTMLLNSLVMALVIACGKIFISILSAYAIVYFKFPLRMSAFWIIFITLMLPVEVRIYPTYKIAADLNMLDTYAGLTLPLVASATATLLFRQFFMTVPDELVEASRIDGAGPFRFFFDTLLPLSRTNMAALFVILFIYGWNQYLWPLLITTRDDMQTIVIGIKKMIVTSDALTEWQIVMATAMLAMLPPVFVVIAMQKLFVRGLVETEK